MSEMSQGPGWWQAADGKWYAPEQHPNYQPPAPQAPAPQPPPQPMAPPPQMAAPPPMSDPAGGPAYGAPPAQKSSGNKGCIIAVVIVLVLFVGAAVTARLLLGKVTDNLSESTFGKTSCDAISKEDVDKVLGGNYDVLQLGGFTNIAVPVLDARVLPDGKTCWASESTNTDNGRLVRIATASGGAARFQAEKAKAQGSKENRGNGLSIETEGYFSKDVQMGDEAFCTTGDLTGNVGVLVRRGDKLIYVSVGGFTPGSTPTLDFNKSGPPVTFTTDTENCELAQKLADKVKV